MQTTSETTKKLNSQIHSGVREASEVADKALNTIEKASNEFGRQAGQVVSRLSETTKDYYNTSEDYVKNNPAKGVAIAAGAGLVLGSLLTMALRRKH